MKNILTAIVFCLILISCDNKQSSKCETYMVIESIEKYNSKMNKVKCAKYNECANSEFGEFIKNIKSEKFQLYLRNDRDVKVGDTIRFDLR